MVYREAPAALAASDRPADAEHGGDDGEHDGAGDDGGDYDGVDDSGGDDSGGDDGWW